MKAVSLYYGVNGWQFIVAHITQQALGDPVEDKMKFSGNVNLSVLVKSAYRFLLSAVSQIKADYTSRDRNITFPVKRCRIFLYVLTIHWLLSMNSFSVAETPSRRSYLNSFERLFINISKFENSITSCSKHTFKASVAKYRILAFQSWTHVYLWNYYPNLIYLSESNYYYCSVMLKIQPLIPYNISYMHA